MYLLVMIFRERKFKNISKKIQNYYESIFRVAKGNDR